MSQSQIPPIFDGHNDVLLRLFKKRNGSAARDFLEGDGQGHLDLPRMKKGGFCGGFFAIFVPSAETGSDMDALMRAPEYDLPLPDLMTEVDALPVALSMAALLARIERGSEGQVKICRTAGEVRACIEQGVLAVIFHIEGAEPIDADLHALEVLHAAGLRSIGPVWSRPNIFGHGVPFRFPGTPDIGPGLTDAGERLVKRCDELRIMIDLSHLNEKGFWDVARISAAPLVATHSNAHSVCEHSRNLTDKQLAAIAERRGMVGVNFATCFIRPDGQMDEKTPLEQMLRHMDHLIDHVGIDHVGMGSDFDGAKIPVEIGDVAGLPALREAMRKHGYDDATMRKLCFENWAGLLDRVLDA